MNGKDNRQAGKAPGLAGPAASAGRRPANENDLARIYLPGALAPGRTVTENTAETYDLTVSRGAIDLDATAGLVPAEELRPGHILPLIFKRRTVPAVAREVVRAARQSGAARIPRYEKKR